VVSARRVAAQAAAASLEQAAKSANLPVVTSPVFTPTSYVPDLGRMNEVIGAAFALPVGAVSDPIETPTDVVVLRVDRRVPADSAVWAKQKDTQRQNVLRDLRRQHVEEFLSDLREVATIADNRKAVEAATRAPATGSG
jgi:hypothetical protein